MHIEFLIEDYSGGEALNILLPSCLAPETEYQVRNFSGKMKPGGRCAVRTPAPAVRGVR